MSGNREVVIVPNNSDKQIPVKENLIGEPFGEVLSNSVDQNQVNQSQQDPMEGSDEENSIQGEDMYSGNIIANLEDEECPDVSQEVRAWDLSPSLNSSLKDKSGISLCQFKCKQGPRGRPLIVSND